MKGAYSGPDSLLYRYLRTSLFTDTAYGKDSGGDPEHIPQLSYAEFKRSTGVVSSSNAYIFIYGDIPTDEHLKFLDRRLSAFPRRSVRTEIARQPRWTQPRSRTEQYPIGKDEAFEGTQLCDAALDCGGGERSGRGARLYSAGPHSPGQRSGAPEEGDHRLQTRRRSDALGYSPGTLETTYHVGIKGSEGERAAAFEQLVQQTLKRIADGGITGRWWMPLSSRWRTAIARSSRCIRSG